MDERTQHRIDQLREALDVANTALAAMLRSPRKSREYAARVLERGRETFRLDNILRDADAAESGKVQP